MKHILYCIFGASGSGKTTLLQNLVYIYKVCDSVQKFSTREERPPTYIHDIEIKDDSVHVSKEDLEKNCDIIYESNGNQYGFNSKLIVESLQKNDVMIVLSDIRALKLLKSKIRDYGYNTKIIYLSSKMESPQQFLKVWQSRTLGNDCDKDQEAYNKIIKKLSEPDSITGDNLIVETCNFSDALRGLLPESDTYRRREEKIRLMYTRYIHNIGLFDHVILNYGENESDMITQGLNIIEYNKGHKKKKLRGPVIFILCASPKSGKGTLMENLNIMGASKIQITPKYAEKAKPIPGSREASEVKRDGMVMKGIEWFDDVFADDDCDEYWKWKFHVNKENPNGTSYSVRIDEIKNRLKRGISQVFVANFDQIKKLSSDFTLQKKLEDIKDKFVFIYLHRVRGKDELDEQFKLTGNSNEKSKIEVRREEVDKVYKQYIDNISSISHVIINPSYLTYREDLHDQMMTLIELYSKEDKKKKEDSSKNMVLIIGGSGVGKTYILQHLDKLGDKYEVVKKYTTRKARENEDRNETIDLFLNCSREDVQNCDYFYNYRNEFYGFNRRDIEAIMSKGHIPLFVVRRMDTIRKLKTEYPDLRVLFCKSGLNQRALFEYLLQQGNSVQDLEKRLDEKYEEESRLEYEKYSDLIDYRVTNDYDERFLEEIKICLPY